jgi:hypothetical protein
MNDLRSILEILSFAAAITIAIVALFGLRQIRLMKIDMRSRSDRAASEKAIEAAALYHSSFFEESSKLMKSELAAKLPFYYGPIGDFTKESIPAEDYADAKARVHLPEGLSALNQLDMVSAMYYTGVADEKVGFEIIGRSFCKNVELMYDMISYCHSDKACPHYQNIVRLYHIWSPRLSKSELMQVKGSLDKQIAQIPEREIPTIGPKVK